MCVFIVIVLVICIIIAIVQLQNEDSNRQSNAEWMKNSNFTASSSFSNDTVTVYVNENESTLLIFDAKDNSRKVIKFQDIIGAETFEDGQTTNGVGRAIVGGALFGGTGAVVGAVTGKKEINKMEIYVYLKDINNPNYRINVIRFKTKTDSGNYRRASDFTRRFNSVVKAIVDRNENSKLEANVNIITPSNIVVTPNTTVNATNNVVLNENASGQENQMMASNPALEEKTNQTIITKSLMKEDTEREKVPASSKEETSPKENVINYMYMCPRCKKVFKMKGDGKKAKCPSCSNLLVGIHIPEDEWTSYDKAKKSKIISIYME